LIEAQPQSVNLKDNFSLLKLLKISKSFTISLTF